MSNYQERVTTEHEELNVKLNTLTLFIGGPMFSSLAAEDQDLLVEQRSAMAKYRDILRKRIERF